MKLYRKQLNSIEALKRETLRLKYERRQTTLNADELFPVWAAKAEKKEKGNAGILELALSLINAKSPLDTALAVAGPVFGMIRGRKKQVVVETRRPKGKSFTGRLVRELLVGYITGKAVQLTVRGVSGLLKKRRRKAQARKAAAQLRPEAVY